MLNELEKIAGKVANAPRPPLPGGIIEEVPDEDPATMMATQDGARIYLPAGAVIEYRDENDNFSVRRITLVSAEPEGTPPSLNAYCHVRRGLRRFQFDRIERILDPHGAVGTYSSPEAFLNWFRYDREGPEEGETAARSLLRAARHELTVLMFFTRCDGYLHPAERSVLLDYITKTYGDDAVDPDDLWEVVRRLYPDSDTMMAAAKAIVDADGTDALDDLRVSIRRLIEADGVIHNNEALHAIELAYLKDNA
ncbi:MAG: hypothetical protein R8L07_13790 [Alphaproteobacteria bacterium]|nr:hypothetical protein [Alphaproteobacteria bacterium]